MVILVTVFAGTIWDESTAIHIKASEIEDSTLVIGTHLIHLSALTEELYDIAMESADESGQGNIYYKSELADSTWFDVTTASSLTDITNGGTPVDNSVIEALFFTHHTKSDGITYDLRTSKAVCIFDIRNPYELETMDELFPLKNKYDLIRELQGDSKAGKAMLARIEEIFKLEVKNDTTDKCDSMLSALQIYYDVLNKNGGSAEAMSVVQGVMDSVDATRRAVVYSIIEDALNAYALELQSVSDTTDEEGNVTEGSGSDTSLQSAVNESLSNITNALTEFEGKMLSEGTTVMTNVKYELSQKLITDAETPDHAACDVDVDELLALENILNAVVANKEKELSMLDNKLLPKSTERYLNGLKSGENAEYISAVNSNASRVVLNGIIDSATSILNAYRNELESYITAECLRLENRDAQSYLNGRLEQAYTYQSLIKNDNFAEAARTTVDSHITFLSKKLRELELAAGGNELDKLIVEKADLQSQYMSALDKNDLQAAQEIEAKIAAIDKQIQEIEESQNNQLSELYSELAKLKDELAASGGGTGDGTGTGTGDGTGDGTGTGSGSGAGDLLSQIAALEGKILAFQAKMSDGSVGNIVAELKAECLDIIGGDGSRLDTLSDDIDTLGGMLELSPLVVFPALKEIYDAMTSKRDLNDDNSFTDQINVIEDYILNNKSMYDAAMLNELSADDFESIAKDYFAGKGNVLDSGNSMAGAGASDITDLSREEQAVVFISALMLYNEETGSEDALALLQAKTQNQMNLGNPLVFPAIADVSYEYLPITAIASYTHMRYVWNNNLNQSTLAKGATYYLFTLYSNAVVRSNNADKTEYMSVPAQYKTVIQIPDDYAYEKFGVEAIYIPGTSYGMLSSDKLNGFAEELFSLFLS